uniref:Endonuclease_NS domain-containing protein n=1 Tax=Meloidogyne hapla TaxID=6305 RepID=A0A1I8BJW2_MELHA
MNKIKPVERFYWLPDPNFSEIFQPKYTDYDGPKRFELDHGHLATAFLHPFEQGYYLTNSVPQYDKINRGHWRVIEEYIR